MSHCLPFWCYYCRTARVPSRTVRRLEGKVILVTGSATGIGEGIARRIATEGGVPIIHGRENERASGEIVAIETRGLFIAGELSEASVPAKLISATVEKYGRLDGLVNNAGVSWRGGIEATAEFFDQVFAINARAPFLLIQAALPHLKSSAGSIVNIGSGLGRHGTPNLLPYSMSKSALANLTRSLSGTFARESVRINGLNLGWTLTPNEERLNVETKEQKEGWAEEVNARQPLGRLLAPTDIAPIVAYLLSSEAVMVTGQVWDFDQRSFGG